MSAKIETMTLKDFGKTFRRYKTQEQFLNKYPTHDMTPNSTTYALVGTTRQKGGDASKFAMTMPGGGRLYVPKGQKSIYLDDGNLYIIEQADGFSLPVGRGVPTKPALIIDAGKVSNLHAMLKTHEGGVSVKDADSKNGTFVNSKKVSGWTQLGDGDTVAFSEDAIYELYMPPEFYEFMKKRTLIEGM